MTLFLSYIKILLKPKKIILLINHYKLYHKHKCKKNNIQIGFGTSIIKSKLSKNVFIGANNSLVNVEIGKNSYTNSNTKIMNAKIGNFSCLGSNVNIGVGIHPTNLVSIHPTFYSNNKGFNTFSDSNFFDEYPFVNIGNDVWIGSNATILGSITIGDGAVIAYGAVVTKDVEPYSIVGGVPATVLKKRFNENIINSLLTIKWWNFEDEFYKKNFRLFHDPGTFIDFCYTNRHI